jgi:hypothetical protein
MDCEDHPLPSRQDLQREWDVLSAEEQMTSRESFEHLCQQGIGDLHRFYPLLMSQALHGYVGD